MTAGWWPDEVQPPLQAAPSAAVALTNGETTGTLIGPADKLGQLVRPEAVVCDCGSPVEDPHTWNPRMCPPTPVPVQSAAPTAADDLREQIIGTLIGQPVIRDGWTVPLTPRDAHLLADVLLPALRALVEAAQQRDEFAERLQRVRSMRAVATDGKVTVAAIDWALGGGEH